jgi:5-hydroxyisourate hydrolase-like protein (transthyretin family)
MPAESDLWASRHGLSPAKRRLLSVPLAPLIALLCLAPASALAATQTITGTATDLSNGNAALTGVSVTLVDSPSGVDDSNVTTNPAVTPANGTYTFSSGQGLAAGGYYLKFSESGYQTVFYDGSTPGSTTPPTASPGLITIGTSNQTVTANQGMSPLDLTVSGTVTDASDSQPIVGATVTLVDGTTGVAIAGHSPVPTSATGAYSFSNVAYLADGVKVKFTAPDFTTLTSSAVAITPNGTPTVNGALVPSNGHVTGTVTDASTNAGIGGVEVDVYDTTGGFAGSATTAANGAYTVTGLDAGTYYVEFVPAGTYVPQWYNGRSGASTADPVTVAANTTTTGINAKLATGGRITGTVTDASTGKPLQDAAVDILTARGNVVRQAMTAADGTYTAAGLPTGAYFVEFVSVSDPTTFALLNYAYQFYSGAATFAGATAVSVTNGSTTSNINAAMAAGGQIAGTATDASTGKGIAGADVIVRNANGSEVADVVTASDGTYKAIGLPTGNYTVLFQTPDESKWASVWYNGKPSAATADTVAVTAGSTTSNINEALVKPGSISGTVTYGPSGAPLQGVMVDILDAGGNVVAEAITGSDGSYILRGLLPGTYKVKFSPGGAGVGGRSNLGFQYYNGKTTLASATAVSVASGASVTGINGSLAPGGSISGTVTDAASKAGVRGAEVDLEDTAGNVLDTAITKVDGTWVMPGVPAGSYVVKFVGGKSPSGVPYQIQYYNNQLTLAAAQAVTVTAGATTPNVSAALNPDSTAAPSNTVTVTTPVPTPGPPTISGGSLSGVGKRKVTIKFKLTSGDNNAPLIKSFKVKLPSGIGWVAKGLRKGVKVTGAKFSDKISGGSLVVTLTSAAKGVSVTISSSAVSVSKSLAAKAKKKNIASLIIVVQVTDAGGKLTSLSFTVKKPT